MLLLSLLQALLMTTVSIPGSAARITSGKKLGPSCGLGRLSGGSCPTPPLSWRELAASDPSMWGHKAQPPPSPATALQGPPGSRAPSVVTSAQAPSSLCWVPRPSPSPGTEPLLGQSPQALLNALPSPAQRSAFCVPCCPISARILLSEFSQNLPSPISDRS